MTTRPSASLLLILSLAALGACADSNGAPSELPAAVNRPARLATGWTSQEAIVTHALQAFASHDTMRLQELLISPEEFSRILYPELGEHYPAARDQRPEARAFIWQNQTASSRKALRKAMAELVGKHMTLLSLTFPRGGTRYASYTIYEDPQVSVRLDDGTTAEMTALGSIVEIDGSYKLLSYRDRD